MISNRLESPWLRFVVRRIARLGVSLWVLVTAAFLMIHLIPGDPVRGALGVMAPPELVTARREALGLEDPLWQQYFHYLSNLIHGNMGISMTSDIPVAETISGRLPSTLQIVFLAFAVAIVASVPLGAAMSALTRGGRRKGAELTFTSTTALFAAIPEFLLAVGLVYFFAVALPIFPVAGQGGPSSYVLPVLSLAIGPAAILSRLVRVEMLKVLKSDYIRTARAKRLPGWKILLTHALPNALTATITVGGLILGSMVAGTVLVENVFGWPGLGTTIVESILVKDYPVVQGVVLVFGAGVLLVNLAVDMMLAFLDPRSTMKES